MRIYSIYKILGSKIYIPDYIKDVQKNVLIQFKIDKIKYLIYKQNKK